MQLKILFIEREIWCNISESWNIIIQSDALLFLRQEQLATGRLKVLNDTKLILND